MAQQKGILKIKGTMNDMTFYKTADGYLVKEKSEVSKEKIATDPAFQRTRENNSEFGRAGKASKVLRQSIRTMLQNAKDARVTSRLTKEMMRVVKADATSARGLRNVIDGETELLTGFEFNINSTLASTVFAPYTREINRVTGELKITIPAFDAAAQIAAPAGATHYLLSSAGVDIDFEAESFATEYFDTLHLPWNSIPTAPIAIVHTLPANSTHPLFLFLGVQFFQEVNGTQYPLRNGAFNALSIVLVSGV